MRQCRNNSQRFGTRVQDCGQARAAGLVLFFAVSPRLVLDNIFVYCRNQTNPDQFQGRREFVFREQLIAFLNRVLRGLTNRMVSRSERRATRRIRNFAAKITRDHRQRAAGKIAQSICQIRVIALHESIERERSILSEDDFTQQKISQRVRAQNVENRLGADNVPPRLRHLAFFKQQPAVGHDALW